MFKILNDRDAVLTLGHGNCSTSFFKNNDTDVRMGIMYRNPVDEGGALFVELNTPEAMTGYLRPALLYITEGPMRHNEPLVSITRQYIEELQELYPVTPSEKIQEEFDNYMITNFVGPSFEIDKDFFRQAVQTLLAKQGVKSDVNFSQISTGEVIITFGQDGELFPSETKDLLTLSEAYKYEFRKNIGNANTVFNIADLTETNFVTKAIVQKIFGAGYRLVTVNPLTPNRYIVRSRYRNMESIKMTEQIVSRLTDILSEDTENTED